MICKDYSKNEAFQLAVAEYRKQNETYKQGFFKFPNFLLCGKYAKLSPFSRMLYALMLEREKLSQMNNWKDITNRPYIYYTTKDVADLFKISMPTATGLFSELANVGLIEKRRQGLGKPTIIYVNKPFEYAESYVN